jgi:hypothetical protein
MPNGKPGDHPLTDIVVHNATIFGAEIDDKVRQIYSGASPELRSHLAALLYAWPRKNTSFASPVTDTNELSYVMDTLLACVAAQRSQP